MIESCLTSAARAFWDGLRSALDGFGVAFRENPRIVRGLDYYSHTAFEFVTDKLGAQGTILAGGRYDGLVADMGGPQTPAIGWAAGIERLSMLLDHSPAIQVSVAVVPMGEAAQPHAIEAMQSLRRAGIRAEMSYRGNLKRRMERANRIGAGFAVIIGDDEAARGVVQLKNLGQGNQCEVAIDALPSVLAARRA
jgi:histidyl-tRNA synthetase